TDQPDHDNVGLGETGHHAQQHTLADAGTGEQPEALTATDRQQTVDAANAHVKRLADRVTLERVDGRAVHWHPVFSLHPALAIQRTTGAIEYPPEHAHAHRQATVVRQRNHPCAWRNAGDAADRHQKHFAAGEAHDFGFDLHRVIAVIVDDHAAAAHGGAQAFGF